MTASKPTLQDVFNQVMLEEPKPNKEALLRWQERYPKYSKELADFFMTWSLQEIRSHRPNPVTVDEDKLAAKGVSHALEILRKQGRILPKAEPEALKPFDQLVLTAVETLRGKADIASVTEKVGEIAGRRVALGSTFVALARLESRHLISGRPADPAADPDDDDLKYYAITLTGERALAHAQPVAQAVMEFREEMT